MEPIASLSVADGFNTRQHLLLLEKTMVNLPSVRHLRHFIALHETLHFGRAAAACHVTQSTLSASIKELEDVLETTLVDRTKRRVVLTPIGAETTERARRILNELEELVQVTNAARDPLSGTLRLGSVPTIGPYLLPRVLPGLREAYDRLKLYLVEDLTDGSSNRCIAATSTCCCSRCLTVVVTLKPRYCSKIRLLWHYRDSMS